MAFHPNYPGPFQWQNNETNMENMEAFTNPGAFADNSNYGHPGGAYTTPAPAPMHPSFFNYDTSGIDLSYMPNPPVQSQSYGQHPQNMYLDPQFASMGMNTNMDMNMQAPMPTSVPFPQQTRMSTMPTVGHWAAPMHMQIPMANMFQPNAQNMMSQQMPSFTGQGMQHSQTSSLNPMAPVFNPMGSNFDPTLENIDSTQHNPFEYAIDPALQVQQPEPSPQPQNPIDEQDASHQSPPPGASDTSTTISPDRTLVSQSGTDDASPNGAPAPNNQITADEAVIIREEPMPRDPPAPNEPRPPLQSAEDLATETGYSAGNMDPEEACDYLESMAFVGKPKSEVRERFPVAFEQYRTLPPFEGNLDDRKDVETYFNVIADWSNRFCRASIDGYDRLTIDNKKLEAVVAEYTAEVKRTQEMLKLTVEDGNLTLSECILRMQSKCTSLEAEMRMVRMHHDNCPKNDEIMGSYNEAPMVEQGRIANYQAIIARKDRELRTHDLSIKQKTVIIDKLEAEIRNWKKLTSAHQFHIQTLFNKNNYLGVMKQQVDDGLKECLAKNKNLVDKYNELYENAKYLTEENQDLKRLIEDAGGERSPGSDIPNITFTELFEKYQKLFVATGNIVSENGRLAAELKKATEQSTGQDGSQNGQNGQSAAADQMEGVVTGSASTSAQSQQQKAEYEQMAKDKKDLEHKLAEKEEAIKKLRKANKTSKGAASSTEGTLSAADREKLTAENEALQEKLREQLNKNEELAASNTKLNNLHLIKDIKLQAFNQGRATNGSQAQPTVGQLLNIMAEDGFHDQMKEYLRMSGAL
ncbi:hypothetical protein ABW21_db0206971 [Orbilia brochopaga]|nr:hypothetical protein ABW21_db0206971 [Drechslerella brochopaga]